MAYIFHSDRSYIGATLGHIIIGLKPVHYNTEKPVTLKQAAIRHLLDPVDYFFLFGLVGIFFNLFLTQKSESRRSIS